MRKFYSAFRLFVHIVIISVIAIYTLSYILLSVPGIQDRARRIGIEELSALLGTRVEIDRIQFSPFNKLELFGVYLPDQQGDTLVYANKLSAGIALTHFSNGNTKFPNAGLNSVGGRMGLSYNFGRRSPEVPARALDPDFPRHMSYDLVLFGSWRRRGIEVGDKQYAAPDAYTVVGFNFAPMYNFGYMFRAGVSLDGVYDGSANVISDDTSAEIASTAQIETINPGFDRQIALGVSARAEFVMPYFNIGIGMGVNVLHKGGDLRSFYQILALKVAVTHNSFIHIGYSLRDFHMPNFLMLGVGYRFNNRYPRHR